MKQKNKDNYQQKDLPKWNLNDLYDSPNSQEIKRDLLFLENHSKLFEKNYFKKVSKLSASNLSRAITKLELIDVKMDKILSYAHLLVAENGNHEKNKIFSDWCD